MQELERIGKEQSLVIAVGYMLRYNPAIEAAKSLLKEVRPTLISHIAGSHCGGTCVIPKVLCGAIQWQPLSLNCLGR